MKRNLATIILAAAAVAPVFAAKPAPVAEVGAPAAETAAAAPFTSEERDLIHSLSDEVVKALRESGLPADAPISALPISGDRECYLEGLLKIAVTSAGLAYVEGREDPMWDAIVSEIIWDWRKTDILDATTLTKFGRLQATRQLLYGRLILDRDEDDELRAELRLHISSVETKRHVWGRTFRKPVGPGPGPGPFTFIDFPVVLTDAQLRVVVDSVAADGAASSKTLAGAMGAEACDTLAGAGFAVFLPVDAKDPEVKVAIKSAAPAFDREDDYVRFSGDVELLVTVPADGNRIIGDKGTLVRRSKRALGDAAALDNLREDMLPVLRDWLGKTITVEAVGLRSVTLQADFTKVKEPELEQRIATLVDAVSHLDGVRDARLVSRLPLPNGTPGTRVTLRVLFRPVDVPEGIGTRLVAKRPDLFKKAVRAK